MLTRCPECQQMLSVGENTRGSTGRCECYGCDLDAAPTNVAADDETVFGWILEDVQNVRAMQAKHRAILPEA